MATDTPTPKKEEKRLNLKAAIQNSRTAPQGTLEQIESKHNPADGRYKAEEDKIFKRITINCTKSEYEQALAKAAELQELNKNNPLYKASKVTATDVAKIALIEYLSTK